jgi:ubiquinone/menaquinone biosynthesis C-methylase UbiE
MVPGKPPITSANVNAAFSKQSPHFDEEDFSNPILQTWRQEIYRHVDSVLKKPSRILELNAGTGIDAVRFVRSGHTVHATDLSDGMIEQLKEKKSTADMDDRLTVQQMSFDQLQGVNGKFDLIFSNFGGLNCLDDLMKVTRGLPALLEKNGYVVWVIMPPVCFWEWTWAIKGNFKKAFRRLRKKAIAHLEGEYFMTYYFSLRDLTKAFGPDFHLVSCEALGLLSPPPASYRWVEKYPRLIRFLNRVDRLLAKRFPFNRWGDHLIVTFQYQK